MRFKNAQTKGKSCHCSNISRMLIIKNMLLLQVSINTPATMTNRKCIIKNEQTQENHVTALKYLKNANYREYTTNPGINTPVVIKKP